jgi:hypothetical protein
MREDDPEGSPIRTQEQGLESVRVKLFLFLLERTSSSCFDYEGLLRRSRTRWRWLCSRGFWRRRLWRRRLWRKLNLR